jgi:dipeptidyl aminopeptidase/acylaminoacyl peptidase
MRVDSDMAYISGQVGGDVVIYRVGLSGFEAVERVVETHGSAAYLMDIGRDGEVLYVVTSFVEPPELMLGQKRVTHLNDELVSTVARPNLKKLQVTASDGLETEAWALTPPARRGRGRPSCISTGVRTARSAVPT